MQAWTLKSISENKAVKIFIFILSLTPIVWLIILGLTKGLGANPIQKILHTTGDWTLNFLLITLSITPLHEIAGWARLIRFRRMIGLFSFFYASIHFITYIGIDQTFSWSAILEDVAKHRRIIVGFVSFILLIPIAVTSTNRMVQRLGYKRWKTLHRLAYVSAFGGVIHYILLVKKDIWWPLTYAFFFSLLLGYRLFTYVFGKIRV